MDLLNRYLQAVKFWLPRPQQDDIITELGEDLRSQIEEREAGLDRKLTDAEMESLLKQRGRPLLVAEKYLPQKFLIGPILFPAYWFVLKLVLACYIVPWVAVWAAFAMLDTSYRIQHFGFGIARDAFTLWVIALTAFTVVTVVFAVLERVKDQSWLLEKWSPRQLPPVRNVEQISRFGSATELIFGVAFFTVWWLKILTPTLFDSGGVRIMLAPGMSGYLFVVFFWCFFVLGCGNIALSAFNLVRPYWTRSRRGVRASLNFAAAIILLRLAKTHAGLVVSGTAVPADKAPELSRYLTLSLGMSFATAAVVCVIVGGVDLWRMGRPTYRNMHHRLAF
jgi:hypothetical protein